MPNCYILRGLPGSGKSKLAEKLCYAHPCKTKIVSADSYFIKDGIYVFDKMKLCAAHNDCKANFLDAVKAGMNVIVDNTNTTRKEYEYYEWTAKQHGYNVSVITIETDLTDEQLAKRNTHGVPVETIKRMRERMRTNA